MKGIFCCWEQVDCLFSRFLCCMLLAYINTESCLSSDYFQQSFAKRMQSCSLQNFLFYCSEKLVLNSYIKFYFSWCFEVEPLTACPSLWGGDEVYLRWTWGRFEVEIRYPSGKGQLVNFVLLPALTACKECQVQRECMVCKWWPFKSEFCLNICFLFVLQKLWGQFVCPIQEWCSNLTSSAGYQGGEQSTKEVKSASGIF